MDVKELDLQSVEVKLTDPPFSFPDKDLNKRGGLKTVRGRVLKKLLKYEFKALSTGMLILILSLIACSILLAVQIPLYEKRNTAPDETPWFLILTVMLAVCLNFGTFIGSIGLPSKRYRKNFFKDEGYLTFSIPASAHEQILAKHIAAIVCYVAGWLASVISAVIIISAIGWGDFVGGETVEPMQPNEIVEMVVTLLELLILAVMFPVFLATLDGASAWWEQRLPEKHRQLIVALVVLGVIALFQTLSVVFLLNGVMSEFFKLPPTLILFIFICIGAAIICGLYAYEIKAFKKNINLK